MNGDGFGDVVIGAYETGTLNMGSALVYLGSANGLGSTPVRLTGTGMPGENFGSSVASAGDVNRDGFADLVVGASVTDGGGNAFVYSGGNSGPSTAPTTLSDPRASAQGEWFGSSVASNRVVRKFDGHPSVGRKLRELGDGEDAEKRLRALL
jgi:hypothetical protein